MFHIPSLFLVINIFLYIKNRYLLEEDNPSDNATHKWMVYVRTPPNEKKLESFVKSVTFYLHESYAPNTEVILR